MTETITSGDDDGSKEDNGSENNNDEADGTNEDNDNNPIASPVETCPKGQEQGQFTMCMPIQSCANQPGLGVSIISPDTNDCVNAPLADHPSTE